MTNLKKVLSLVLVFAMALGLMISASAADLSDWDDVENKDAVTLLSALGIMGGHADGTFEPDGFLTRGQVAKMVYVAKRGVDDGANLFKGTSNSQFKDVAGHWAEGYINYAAAMGFVSGDGKGYFKPEASITGYEILKIALTALGYDATVEGFVGPTWQAKVAARALDSGLTEGYDGLAAAPITRDEAARVFSNLIYAETVKYDDGILTTVTAGNPAVPVLFGEKNLRLNKVTGIVTANEYADLSTGNTALLPGFTRIGTSVYPVSTSAELLGQQVSILVKGTPADTTKATIYGGAIVSPLNTVLKISTPKNSTTLAQALVAGGLGTSLSGASTYANAASTSAISAVALGEEVTVIDNDGDKVADYVFVNSYEFGRITAYKAVSATANGTLTITGSLTANGYVPYKAGATGTGNVVVGFDGVALGDYVNYRIFGGKLYVAKAETVTGMLVSKASNNASIGIDGVAYNVVSRGTSSVGSAYLGVTYTAYLDPFKNVELLSAASGPAATNYAYIVEFAYVGPNFANGYKASANALVVLDDGTQAVYAVSAVGSATGTGLSAYDTSLDKKVVKYLIDDDGKISFTIDSNVYESDFAITKGSALIANTYYANDSTVYLFIDDTNPADVKVARYVGKSVAPSFDGTATGDDEFLAYNATTKAANFIVVKSTAPSTATASYAYIIDINYKATLAGNEYDAIIDGELGTLLTRHTDILTTGGEGIYQIVRNDKGQAELGTKVTPSSGTVAYYAENVIIFGTTELKITDSTYIFNLDSTPADGLDAGDVVEYLVSNGTVTYLFITTDN